MLGSEAKGLCKDLINLATKVSSGNPAILEQIVLVQLDLLKIKLYSKNTEKHPK